MKKYAVVLLMTLIFGMIMSSCVITKGHARASGYGYVDDDEIVVYNNSRFDIEAAELEALYGYSPYKYGIYTWNKVIVEPYGRYSVQMYVVTPYTIYNLTPRSWSVLRQPPVFFREHCIWRSNCWVITGWDIYLASTAYHRHMRAIHDRGYGHYKSSHRYHKGYNPPKNNNSSGRQYVGGGNSSSSSERSSSSSVGRSSNSGKVSTPSNSGRSNNSSVGRSSNSSGSGRSSSSGNVSSERSGSGRSSVSTGNSSRSSVSTGSSSRSSSSGASSSSSGRSSSSSRSSGGRR